VRARVGHCGHHRAGGSVPHTAGRCGCRLTRP
jgi:hypothetical protein